MYITSFHWVGWSAVVGEDGGLTIHIREEAGNQKLACVIQSQVFPCISIAKI